MANPSRPWRPGLAKELTVRVVAITFIYALLSMLVVQRVSPALDRLLTAVPLLFATYGAVVLISVWYCLRRYRVMKAK